MRTGLVQRSGSVVGEGQILPPRCEKPSASGPGGRQLAAKSLVGAPDQTGVLHAERAKAWA